MSNWDKFTEGFEKYFAPTREKAKARNELEARIVNRPIPLPQALNPEVSDVLAVMAFGENLEYESITAYNKKTKCLDVAISIRNEETNNKPIVLIGATFAAIHNESGLLLDMRRDEATEMAEDINSAFSSAIEPHLEFLCMVVLQEIVLDTDKNSVAFNQVSGMLIIPKG
jgi:hypothetical protein